MNSLNEQAWNTLELLFHEAEASGCTLEREPGGALLLDAGCRCSGGLAGGLILARASMAGLARVNIRLDTLAGVPWPCVEVQSSRPVEACLQPTRALAGEAGGYQAMGSGPACLLRAEIAGG